MAFQKILKCAVNPPEEFICDSGDEKITEDIPVGSKCKELDTNKDWIFDGVEWRCPADEAEEEL